MEIIAFLFVFLMATYGLTQIIVYGDIFEEIRERLENVIICKIKKEIVQRKLIILLNCMMCMGFWVGIIIYLLHPLLFKEYSLNLSMNLLAIICWGFISSGFSFAMSYWLGWLKYAENKNKERGES